MSDNKILFDYFEGFISALSIIFNNQANYLNLKKSVSFVRFSYSFMAFIVALMMLLSTGGNLLIAESEAESPVQESQENEVDSVEIYVRHSKPRKIRRSTITAYSVTDTPKCCYQHVNIILGHQLENGLIAPLIC